MKTNFKFFAVAIAAIMTIGSVTLVSCDKEESTKQIAGMSNIKNNPLSNTNNPYDSIGLMHNNAMSDLIFISDGLPSSMQEAIASAEKYLYEKGFDTIGDYALVSEIIDGAKSNYFTFVSSQNLSSASIDAVNAMMYDIATMSLSGNYNGYESYRKYLMNVESRIIASKEIPSYEKDELLTAAAVYRYSLYYWYNTFENAKLPLWGKIAIIAGADVVGGLVAGGQGAIAASWASAAVLSAAKEVDAKVDSTDMQVTYTIDL